MEIPPCVHCFFTLNSNQTDSPATSYPSLPPKHLSPSISTWVPSLFFLVTRDLVTHLFQTQFPGVATIHIHSQIGSLAAPSLSKSISGDFPSGPVVKTPHFHCRSMGSIPGPGTEILHATQCCKIIIIIEIKHLKNTHLWISITQTRKVTWENHIIPKCGDITNWWYIGCIAWIGSSFCLKELFHVPNQLLSPEMSRRLQKFVNTLYSRRKHS